MVVAAGVSLGMPAATTTHLWWSESRPAEAGRTQVVAKPFDEGPLAAVDVLPDGVSARTLVHEYGGVSFWPLAGESGADDVLVVANHADQRLLRFDDPLGELAAGRPPVGRPITPDPVRPRGLRYADVRVGRGWAGDPRRRWIVAVRERHHDDGVANEIVGLPLEPDGGEPAEPVVLVTGPDFVSSPRLSPDGGQLAWLQWNDPDMPWDGAELWLADVVPGVGGVGLTGPHRIAGGDGVSVAQPEWSPDGRLHHVSDAGSGWWNLRCGDEVVDEGAFEAAQPQWVFGQSWYAWDREGRRVAARRRDGRDELTVDGVVIDVGATAFDGLVAAGDGVAMLAGGFDRELAVVVLTSDELTVHRPPRDLGIDPAWFSRPDHITFPTSSIAGTDHAHALVYPPTNPTVAAGRGPAPLLVLGHGGPTSAARPVLNLVIQHWTSRGYVVADVNYRGSTGYGRGYRDALRGSWGIADVDDCVACARHLVAEGVADPARLAIKGGSAGGFTVLCALVDHDVFTAGSSLYGVADLETLATETHKFEARYLDGLVGPYPEARATYVARSPVHRLEQLACPLVIFQGLEDEVVPPSQAEAMVAVLRAKQLPFAYLPFAGEQHGFRIAANIERVVQAEHYFFSRVFGLPVPTEGDPVVIENLPDPTPASDPTPSGPSVSASDGD